MKAAYDVGINFFDCAEGYSGGESERVMGQAIKKYGWKRNDLVISTKVCTSLGSCGKYISHNLGIFRSTGVVHTVITQLTTAVSRESTSLKVSTWPLSDYN